MMPPLPVDLSASRFLFIVMSNDNHNDNHIPPYLMACPI